MAKLLYIQASPRDRSKSTKVATAFLDSYQQSNPDDQIETLNVFEKDLPPFDGFAVQAKYSIMHGQEHSDDELQAWSAVETLIDEFKTADKYLFSLPMWNFGIPYRLKQYIDIIVQPGYTFSADENGYEGLVKGKPAVVVYARGGAYSEGSGLEAFDLQKKYFDLVLGFIGFEDVQSIIVEPTMHVGPEEVQAMVQASIGKAAGIAKEF
ncbi:MAG: FMN-dependent NADH-azoreductase [Planctomycetota bacterium]|jgi:FMN-dependent NADH-azoreductase